MFDLRQNFWTPLVPAQAVGKTPLALTLAGVSLVLFRDQEGQIRALRDRCSHRGVALSLGRVTSEGCLECPYHGWQFDGEGACVQVPFNHIQTTHLARLGVPSFPCQVVAGCVWVFTGPGTPPALAVPDSLRLPETTYYIHQEIWNAHWSRVIEANLDFAHLPFVHRESFGQIALPTLAAGETFTLRVDDYRDRLEVFTPYRNVPASFALEWHQPNLVMVKFDDMGLPVKREHFFAVPINEHQTRCLVILQMRPELDAQTQQSAAQEFIKPLLEDRLVVETQVGAVPVIDEECHVPTDKPTLLFRRWYHQTLARPSLSQQTAA